MMEQDEEVVASVFFSYFEMEGKKVVRAFTQQQQKRTATNTNNPWKNEFTDNAE